MAFKVYNNLDNLSLGDNFRIFICAGSESGKTILLKNFLRNYSDLFDLLYLVCPEGTEEQYKNFFFPTNIINNFDDFNSTFGAFMSEIKTLNLSRDTKIKTLIVFDDFGETMKHFKFLINMRHANISCVGLLHNITNIEKGQRVNVSSWILASCQFNPNIMSPELIKRYKNQSIQVCMDDKSHVFFSIKDIANSESDIIMYKLDMSKEIEENKKWFLPINSYSVWLKQAREFIEKKKDFILKE